MLRRVVLSVLVALVAGLVAFILGKLLMAAGGEVSVVYALGSLLVELDALLGLIAGVWYFLTGQNPV